MPFHIENWKFHSNPVNSHSESCYCSNILHNPSYMIIYDYFKCHADYFQLKIHRIKQISVITLKFMCLIFHFDKTDATIENTNKSNFRRYVVPEKTIEIDSDLYDHLMKAKGDMSLSEFLKDLLPENREFTIKSTIDKPRKSN